MEQLLRDGVIHNSDFETCKKFFKNVSAKFAKATEIDAGLIKFNPSDFFSVDNQQSCNAAWEAAIKFLGEKLGDRTSLLVLDDVDSYFVGLENHPRFIEGLCRAVIEINSVASPKLYCILLLKQGVWRTLFESPEEYDKIKSSMEFLKWDLLGCTAVLCRRIAAIHGKPAVEVNQFGDAISLLQLEFAGDAKTIEYCIAEIFSFSVNGPRDIIDLCNNVRRTNPDGKITSAMVMDRVSNYSEEKLYGLNADFGHIYPDVPHLIQSVFNGFRTEFTGDELSERLETGVLTDPRSERQAFGKHNWFRNSTADGIVKKLFDIGVVGVARPKKEALFANESNTVSQNTLLKSKLMLHKAYQPALGLI